MGDQEGSNNGGGRRAPTTDIEKRQEYLSLLQERNRLKKMMTSKTGAQLENEEKEKGFMTHFLGANAQRPKPNPNRKSRHTGQTVLPRRAVSLPCSEIETTKQPVTAPPRRGWAVGRPKFLFGMRVGNDPVEIDRKPESSIGNNSSRMTLEDDDEEEDIGDDYDEDFEDYDELFKEEIEEESNDQYIAEMSKSLGAVPGPSMTSSQEMLRIEDPFKNIPPNSNRLLSPTKTSSQLVFSPSMSPLRTKASNVPGSFGSPLRLQLGSTPGFSGFPQPMNINTKNLSEGFVLSSSFTSPPVTIDNPSTYDESSSLFGPPSRLLPFAKEELSFSSPQLEKPLNRSICIRIRIHNTWNKSKFASLESVRLTFQSNDENKMTGNIPLNSDNITRWIDLRTFSVRIMNGMQQLPASSEAVRCIQYLLGTSSNSGGQNYPGFGSGLGSGSNSVVKNNWKGPLNPGSSLDIFLEGNLPQEYVGMFFDQDSMISSLQLHIWNSSNHSFSSSDPSSSTSSAVKDVDVYLGTVCVWSGTIEEEEGSNDAQVMIKIGKYIENISMAVFAPNKKPSKIIFFRKIPTERPIKYEKSKSLPYEKSEFLDCSVIAKTNKVNNINENITNNSNGLINKIEINTNEIYPRNNMNECSGKSNGDKDNSPPSWLSSLRPKSVPNPHLNPDNEFDFDSHSSPRRSRPVSGRRADPHQMKSTPKSPGKMIPDSPSQGHFMPQSDLLPAGLFDAMSVVKNYKEKNRIFSANGGRRRTVTSEPSSIPLSPVGKSNISIEVEDDSEREENENEIGTFPTSSSYTEQQNSVTSAVRRMRRKEKSTSPDKLTAIIGKRSSKETKDSDNFLRQSLEAINVADRMTRGRVGGLVTPNCIQNSCSAEELEPENPELKDDNTIINLPLKVKRLRNTEMPTSSPPVGLLPKPIIAINQNSSHSHNNIIHPNSSNSQKSETSHASYFRRGSSFNSHVDVLDDNLSEYDHIKMQRQILNRSRNSNSDNDSMESTGSRNKEKTSNSRRRSSNYSVAEKEDILDQRNKRIDMALLTVGATVAGLQDVFKGRVDRPQGGSGSGQGSSQGTPPDYTLSADSSYFAKNASRLTLGKLAMKKEEETRREEEEEREREKYRERQSEGRERKLLLELEILKREEEEGDDGEGDGVGDGTDCVSIFDPCLSVNLSSRERAILNYENTPLSVTSQSLDLEDSLKGYSQHSFLDPKISQDRGSFKTPFFPSGKILIIDIYSTWGDQYYVGLNGLDIFDELGNLICCNTSGGKSVILGVETDNSNILISPEFQDPREPSNLLNGTNFTRNDLHVWLAPLGSPKENENNNENNDDENDVENNGNYNNGKTQDNGKKLITSVRVTFTQSVTISLIRVFNYNKSRTHCSRGVKDCVFRLDETAIYKGEISMATGLLTSADTVSEVLLFTTDSNILEKVAQHDEKAGYYADDTTEEWLEKLKAKQKNGRPSTAEKIETDKIEYEKLESESRDSGQLDRDYFYGTDLLSPFNSTQQSICMARSIATTPIPNSQMATLRAKHTEKNVFYSPKGVPDDFKKGKMEGNIHSNSSYSLSNPPLRDTKQKSDNDMLKTNDKKNPQLKKKNSIADLFDDDNNNYNNNKEKEIKNENNNNNNKNKNYNNYNNNSDNMSDKSSVMEEKVFKVNDIYPEQIDTDFSQTNDMLIFLNEFNEHNRNMQNEREKEIEIEKIRKYDAEKELYLKDKKSVKSNDQKNVESIFVENTDIITCKTLTLLLESSWGDSNYIGLSGMEILTGNNCDVANLTEKNLFASPKDLSEIGCFDDPRVLKNLINGQNDTCDDGLMWLIPYTKGGKHVLQINFEGPTRVAGIRIWNYNKNAEDALRGVKSVKISADNRFLGNSVFRIGPGCDGIEFGHTIYIGDILNPCKARMPALASENDNTGSTGNSGKFIRYISPAVKQDYEAPLHPSGLLWKFIFYENWFDGYYIGLDAIEMFDTDGSLINLSQCGATVTASPSSLQDLVPVNSKPSGKTPDPRTPEKLFLPFRDKDGNKRKEYSTSWLAPLSRSMTNAEKSSSTHRIKQKQVQEINDKNKKSKNGLLILVPPVFEDLEIPMNNVLFVMFPYPVAVSLIRFHNYSKDPSRGVKEFGINVDCLDLCMGALLPSDRENPDSGGGQSVLFTTDPRIVRNEKEKVMIRSKSMFQTPNPVAEGIKSDLNARPSTSYHQ